MVEAQAYIDQEQTAKLEAATKCLRDQLMVRITRRLGCRISETLNIYYENINFTQHRITIVHQKARVRILCPKCNTRLNKGSTFCAGCGSKVESVIQKSISDPKMRTVPIDSDTLDMIRNYVKGVKLTEYAGKHRLFTLSRGRAWAIFVEAAYRAGLPQIYNADTGKTHHVSPHRLRDSFAINALKQDGSLEGAHKLQEHLGHKDIGTTLNYRKVALEEQTAWYDKLFEEKKEHGPE
jgi:integrase/recombinase XerD